MSFESITNRGEYLSAHYLAEVLPATLKTGLLKTWTDEEKGGRVTPRTGLRALRRDYFTAKAELADTELYGPERLRKLHAGVLEALGFAPTPETITVERAGREHEITVAHAELTTGYGIVAIECGWAAETDAAHDQTDAGRLLDPVELDGADTIETGAKLASWLFAAESPPRYVLILNGGVVTLADRTVWGEGRYLAVSLDTAYGRNEDRELDVIAALFGADSLRPPAEGGAEPLADLVAGSRQHAVGVSSELREGLRISVELIANEVLDQIREAGYQPQDVMDLDELARELSREALRYLYRILFLLYAEARPELGVLPVDDPEYVDGYSLSRLGDLISRQLAPSAEGGFHLHESLDLLFRMVNDGHRPRGGTTVGEKDSEGVGLRFEPMRSDLFLPSAIRLIGHLIPEPGSDPDDPDGPRLDTRLRNATLYRVLRLLMITKGGKKRRGGFISYAQLGINQLGAVYEGLMSYTGFVATEQLYEVAKNGDPKDGSWMIPASKADEYEDAVFVVKENPLTGVRSRVSYAPGSFVYRLAGRDRQTSASYYTPQSLTEVTVQLALKYRLDQDNTITPARELLDWTICEPALGSGAFLNEAINQVAAEYLRRRQDELKTALEPEEYHLELQRAKAYIALHNCYGVDLNRTAVELAEVSLWLNVMHSGLQAPWFGLHLRRGNSLIGGGRRLYTADQVKDKSWLKSAPADKPFRDGPIDEGTIHHFLLPADGWGAVAGEKEAKELAPNETERLRRWRTAMKRLPTSKGKNSQVARLQALARRVEFLWDLVQQRLEISEREIRRDIPVWGADDLPAATGAVPREDILRDLETAGTPYWRLRTLMDTWCALWFWPLDSVGLLDGSAPEYAAGSVEVSHVRDEPVYADPVSYERVSLFEEFEPTQLTMPTRTGTRKVTVAEQLRKRVPLTNLDGWLTFAERVIGRADVPKDSLVSHFSTLAELGDYERTLPGLTGMDEPFQLADRFPWLQAADVVAEEQGFFHWELTFAQSFGRGGFDIQVGNPPWVRPRWDLPAALAEFDPWFALTEKASAADRLDRKNASLRSSAVRQYLKKERAINKALVSFLGSASAYPLLVGTQPDLYRAFMSQTWSHSSHDGMVGLIHPDTHFTGDKEASLRSAAYARLRIHGDFVNPGHRFFPEPVGESSHFGVHIYGPAREIGFDHLCWLFSVDALRFSSEHDGSGDPPGVRYNGALDERPHRARIVHVTREVLAQWQQLTGENQPVEHARLLSPVSIAEASAIRSLANYPIRLGLFSPQISRGFDESGAKNAGIIDYDFSAPDDWSEVILKGPQLGPATPLFKGPNPGSNDVLGMNLMTLPIDAVPASEYRRTVDRQAYEGEQDRWIDYQVLEQLTNSPDEVAKARASLAKTLAISASLISAEDVHRYLTSLSMRRYTEFYRLAWRRQIAPDTERSLYAALIPPGVAHIHLVHSLAAYSVRSTVLAAGFWTSMPLDYFMRISGRADLQITGAKFMHAGAPIHPLASALLLRTLRLNCLTKAYSDLWSELYEESWPAESWACCWESLPPLGAIRSTWEYSTPLRTERARRAALVELDALVAVWLGVDADALVAMYRARFPVLGRFEETMWFDADGWKLAGNHRTHGQRQTKDSYAQLLAYQDPDENGPVPDGYTAPFLKAEREREMRDAHAAFQKRLDAAVAAGEWDPMAQEVPGD